MQIETLSPITARVNLERSAIIAAALSFDMSAEAFEDMVRELYGDDFEDEEA